MTLQTPNQLGQKICVFCGSSSGSNVKYTQTAISFAKEIVKHNLTLVYGAGNCGIMGILSDAVIQNGGKVIGVIPQFLADKNLANKNITELKTVKDMHERKSLMYHLSDFFVAMPGGIGTLEEFAEVLTWRQLHLHTKPCALLNIDGFFTNLTEFLQKSVDEGFMKQSHIDGIIVENDYKNIIPRLKSSVFMQEEKF